MMFFLLYWYNHFYILQIVRWLPKQSQFEPSKNQSPLQDHARSEHGATLFATEPSIYLHCVTTQTPNSYDTNIRYYENSLEYKQN